MRYTKKIRHILGCMLVAGAMCSSPVQADSDFSKWVEGVKAEAREQGIDAALLDQAFQGIKPNPRVLELDRRQPESTMTFEAYKKIILSPTRIQAGRQMMVKHREELERIASKYGVPAPYLVALWGIETHYGDLSGGYGIIDALATLAFDGRRSQFFRRELLNALRIVQDGHISFSDMKGSWAGAMGQCQFMPSSFLRFAVDESGDGRKDIWATEADVFGSSANYLAQSGWRPQEGWGRQVTLPDGFNMGLVGMTKTRVVGQWLRLGVRDVDGEGVPTSDLKGSIVLPDGKDGPAFLVYENYHVIMKWNRSTYFATAVGLLADALM